jgi:biotin carboxyl carrier protein
MKMENEIVAHRDGLVTEVRVGRGEQVAEGELIAVIESEPAAE